MKHFQIFGLFLCLLSVRSFSQDIIVNNYSGPTVVEQYEEFQATVTFQNIGIVPTSRQFSAAMFLSTDAIWDINDIPFGGFTIPTLLGVGQSFTASLIDELRKAQPGTYYLIIKADHQGLITETDESNNILIIPNFTIAPSNVDFTITSLTTDKSSYFSNGIINFSYVVENLGTTNTSGSISVRLAISADDILDPYDFNFPEQSPNLSGPDVFHSIPHLSSFVLPAFEEGNYYLIAKVDDSMHGQQNFAETNEANNLVAVPITIRTPTGVDLKIDGVSFSSANSSYWESNVYVSNMSPMEGGGYNIAAQLIPQGGTPQPFDYHEAFFINNNYLGPYSNQSHFLQFNHFVPPGTYYAAYYINYNPTVFESDYSNNIYIDYSNPIVVPPAPILAVTFDSLTIASIVNDTDQQIKLNFNLTNSGTAKNYNQQYSIVIKDSSGTVIHTQKTLFGIDFNPGASVIKTIILNLADPLKIGMYDVSVSCISTVKSFPITMNTVLTITPTMYNLTGTVKGEDGTPLTKGNLFLYQDNGTEVKLLQKTSYTGPTFSLSVDASPHTLYFVPDPVVHPNYIPTIYGKTVMLQPQSFFSTSNHLNLDLEVLKTVELAAGLGVIQGYLTTGNEHSSEGKNEPQTLGSAPSAPSVPVVLMSSGNEPLQITYIDEFGFYKFKNLSRQEYKILICFDLNGSKRVLQPVDITFKNMIVDFRVDVEEVKAITSQLFFKQDLTMNAFSSYGYGNSQIVPDSKSNTSQPITYYSSNPEIATIFNNEIHIKGVGTVMITAKQEGNDFYAPATVSRPLIIGKADQTINLDFIQSVVYGDAPLMLKGVSSSALDISYTSSNASIASVKNNLLTIHKPGTVTITAEQNGNNLYNAAVPVKREVVIHKANQSLTFDDLTGKKFGDQPFMLKGMSSSAEEITFVSSDPKIASINGNLVTIHSSGSVIITAEQSGTEFYNSALPISQTLTVEKANQTISFSQLRDVSTDIGSFELSASASSGLQTFLESSDNEIVSIEGNIATVHKGGVVLITAKQQGDHNFHPANAVARELKINIVLGTNEEPKREIYPNPTSGLIFLDMPYPSAINVSDLTGREYENVKLEGSKIDLSGLKPGVYLIHSIYGGRSSTFKVIKR